MTISNQTITAILEKACAAPSGDNCQPWRYGFQDDVISVYNIPGRDVSQFNAKQRASYIALGAFIENAVAAAAAHQLSGQVSYFPRDSDPDLVALIKLVPDAAAVEPLAQEIQERCTNRRRYQGGSLSPAQQQALVESVAPFAQAKVRLFSGSDQKRIAQVIGLNDRLVFENRDLHAFLFDHIRWNAAEAKESGDGLDIGTLELAAIDDLAFRVFKHYDVVQVLNLVGVSHIIAANARKLARSAAAIGVISLRGNGAQDYLVCGRALERVWLEATRQKLAFQVMTGITCLMGRVMDNDPGSLNASHAALVREGHQTLSSLLGNSEETPMIIFRVGFAPLPSVRSLRLPVKITTP
jgi:hypothetical protein